VTVARRGFAVWSYSYVRYYLIFFYFISVKRLERMSLSIHISEVCSELEEEYLS
jgi:hypothetical protein